MTCDSYFIPDILSIMLGVPGSYLNLLFYQSVILFGFTMKVLTFWGCGSIDNLVFRDPSRSFFWSDSFAWCCWNTISVFVSARDGYWGLWVWDGRCGVGRGRHSFQFPVPTAPSVLVLLSGVQDPFLGLQSFKQFVLVCLVATSGLSDFNLADLAMNQVQLSSGILMYQGKHHVQKHRGTVA